MSEVDSQPRSPVRRAAFAGLVGIAVAACQVAMDPAPGPSAPGDPVPPSEPRVTLAEATVAPGDAVTVQAEGFAPNTPVEVGLGQPASDYSTVAESMTDAGGGVEASVQVPDWAMAGHPYVVVVAGEGAQHRAVSEPFVVGAPGDRISTPGTLTEEGVECPAMRGPQGTLYTLAMADLDWEPGTEVMVEGTIAAFATCMQGTTIDVETIRRR
jgi:hypothetical protein